MTPEVVTIVCNTWWEDANEYALKPGDKLIKFDRVAGMWTVERTKTLTESEKLFKIREALVFTPVEELHEEIKSIIDS